MRLISTVFIFSLFLAQICFGQTNKNIDLYNPLSNNLAVTVDGGLTIGQTDYKDIRLNYIARGSLEYYFFSNSASLISLKGFGGMGIISGKDNRRIPNIFNSTIYYGGIGLGYTYSIDDRIYPFLAVGISSIWYYPEDNNGNKLPHTYNRQMGAYNGELGLKYMISNNVSINISGNMILTAQDYLDNIKSGLHNDAAVTLNAGFTYYFGRNKDSDGDNIPDYIDRCPGTVSNVKVDEFGCPLDSDGDGVPDYMDKCPNTPKGLVVDKMGCPLDSDRDGIPDYKDKCPNTPQGVKVDSNGCPLDSDGDGVPDYKDECPNTPMGTQVDSIGCPIIHVKPVDQKGLNLKGDANFESGKAKLLPESYQILDNFAIKMKQNPNSKWLVEGYTDSVGTNAINLKLSKLRAEAVVNYLVNKGVRRSSLKIKAFGKANPIASNSTSLGRAKNRRVEIRLINQSNK